MAGANPMQAQAEAQMKMARTEMRGITEMYQRMVGECYDKCVLRVGSEAELNVGEMSCVDRCVSKYLEVHDKVGVQFQKLNEQGAGQAPGAAAGGAGGGGQ
uniref:Mitochondrial import inner membrane translocase subunit n=1 Tax=Bicosoecida sp. CB-2014 TaxID=1486930 RepID=A0A7S1C2G8_9STRA|mmetsp:Transcript_11271/g.39272  ORF Transcript_11271/g.39272 Transcript_11271/m.39272 type:complete len:101 (+) Transcript_11271:194-496(+)